jgi:hypothetical protein
MSSLDNGMSMMDVATFWQYIVKGAICCWRYGWIPPQTSGVKPGAINCRKIFATASVPNMIIRIND